MLKSCVQPEKATCVRAPKYLLHDLKQLSKSITFLLNYPDTTHARQQLKSIWNNDYETSGMLKHNWVLLEGLIVIVCQLLLMLLAAEREFEE